MSLVETAIHKLQRSKGRDTSLPAPASEENRNSLQPGTRDVARSVPHLAALPAEGSLTLPRAQLRACGLLPPEERERQLTNQYRRIKRPLIAAALGTETEPLPMGRALVVTSSTSGEGKTFTSLNLAVAFSLEKDHNVLLVDGDVAKRELSTALGIGDRPGLLDLIASADRGIGSCILSTDVPGLYVMPAGERGTTAPEMLGSARMRSVFADFLERNPSCFIVFDSPPVLLAAEARALIPIAGQVIFVVKAGESQKPMVLEALNAIGNNRPISLILNQLDNYIETNYGYDYSAES